MYKRAFQGWLKHIDFILLDELCLWLSMFLALQLRSVRYGSRLGRMMPLLLLVNLFVFIASDSLATVIYNNDWQEWKATLRHGLTMAALSVVLVLMLYGMIVLPRYTILAFWVLYVVLSYLVRIGWRRFLLRRTRSRKSQKELLIVTMDRYAQEVVDHMRQYAFSNYAPNGLILIDRDAKGEAYDLVPVVANLDDAADYICRSWIDEVLFFRSSQDERVQELVERCREMALTVHFYVPMQGVDEERQVVERVAGYNVLTTNLNMITPIDAFIKRIFDVVFGLFGSLMALIALAIIGPKIRKASPGPLLFKQERIGENGKKFKMYKIRSMYMDADRRKAELEAQNSHSDGMLFKLDFDPRVIGNELLPDGTQKTGIGDFIRRTSLDELPQFFNVLRGEMSVVGTRPPTVDEWEKYQYHHRARMSIRPGVTGLWQINDRKDHMSFDEVVKLDTEYIANWSKHRDLEIIARTLYNAVKHI